MRAVPGYALREVLHRGSVSGVAVAVRTADGREVVLKAVLAAFADPATLAQYRTEHACLTVLADHAVPRVHALIEDGPPVLVLDRVPGGELASAIPGGGLPLAEFLTLALGIAEGLEPVHRAGIVHGDLNPTNIMVAPDGSAATLIDFGLSLRIGEAGHASSPLRSAGNLRYVAPEQTGRTRLPIDQRADLYALGATFHHMLTARPPFPTEDPAELIHAHLAVLPEPPSARRPEIPALLSAMVLKLMAKAPDDRYQTAAGVVADLSRLRAELAAGRTPDFPLGGGDRTGRVAPPGTLYGRAAALDDLRRALAESRSGGHRMALIVGPGGVGKSALVDALRTDLIGEPVRLALGKSERLRRDVPYAALMPALGGALRQLLTEPEERLISWRATLTAALGRNGGVLTELLPELTRLIGNPPPPPHLPPTEAHHRFARTLKALIDALATPERPLVLVLDDLHWADRSSLDLLAPLLDGSGAGLLLIGTCRDEADDGTGALPPEVAAAVEAVATHGRLAARIELRPLALPDVTRFVADALGAAIPAVAPLAELVFVKTHGNPFFVANLLVTLSAEGALAHGPDGWTWDAARIAARAGADNVVAFLARRLRELPAATRRVLEAAACLGTRPDPALIAAALGIARSAVDAALATAVNEGLMRAASGGVEFVHDRIQEAAASLLMPEEVQALHLALARLLLDRLEEAPEDASLFAAALHLNRAGPMAATAGLLRRKAEVNVRAAERARATAAFGPALTFAEAALSAMPESAWNEDPAWCARVHLLVAEGLALAGKSAAFDGFADALEPRLSARADTVALGRLRLMSLMARGRAADAAAAGLAALAILGVPLPADPDAAGRAIGAELGEIARLMGGRAPADLAALPPLADEAVGMANAVLVELAPALFTAKMMEHYALAGLTNTRLALAHGLGPFAPVIFATHAVIHLNVTGDARAADAFCRLALDLDARGGGLLTAPVAFVYGYFVSHWVNPLEDGLRLARLGAERGLELGDLEFGSFNLAHTAMLTAYSGAPLDEVAALCERQRRLIGGWQYVAGWHCLLERQVAHALMGLTAGPQSLGDGDVDEERDLACILHSQNAKQGGYLIGHRLRLAYLFGDHAAARTLADTLTPFAPVIAAQLFEAEAATFAALALLTGDPDTGCRARATALLDRLRGWAAVNPVNFGHKALLVEGEAARAGGRPLDALRCWREAEAAAERHRFTPDAALAAELTGLLYEDLGDVAAAGAHLKRAFHRYRQWGAAAKADAMRRRHPGIEWSAGAPARSGNRRSTSSGEVDVDIAAVLKAGQAISGEIALDRLLERVLGTIVENAGAQSGCLLLRRGDALVLRARRGADGAVDTIECPLAACAGAGAGLAHAVVNYTGRTGETVVLDDAQRSPDFFHDPHVAATGVRAVLCAPVIEHGSFAGLIYLENNLTPGAFTEGRVKVVQLLAAQVIISLRNAELYAQMADINSTLERQVAERTHALSQQSAVLSRTLDEVRAAHEQLKLTQQQLVQAEKLAALGQLVAGVAHEINTPLGVAVTGASHLVDETARIQALARDGRVRRSDFDLYLESAGELAGLLLTNVARAGELVQSFKLVAADQTGDDRRAFTLKSWLDDLMTSLSPSWKRAGHSVCLDCPDGVTLDSYPGALAQVLTNLTKNALDHAFPNGRAGRISLSVQPLEGAVEMVFADDGAGIAAEHRAKVFDPFFTTRRNVGNTGLGLHITYNLVTSRLGGEIRLDGADDGTRFVLHLPLSAPNPEQPTTGLQRGA
ncbi:AAA family ATPase [Azospirillum sp. TSO22-1]|uniref:AAA family ATPase n=1 Tax=Azospirillum sp. TSO22-1 TaxID=716789 RepID=UPI000D62260A|nr:AAA family ATPase [Azospirillum sp. TSO22-1]PWC38775.1 hypothetical protein TSO221_26270 [Azospirillum sp. TSO22-1]